MVTFVLGSDDGCRYEFSLHLTVAIAYDGGLAWDKTSELSLYPNTATLIGNRPFAPNISASSPYARFNVSGECRDRDMILLSTPWTKPVNISLGLGPNVDVNQGLGPNVDVNQTYERSEGFRMKGLLCESQYHMESRYVSASLSGIKQTVVTNTSSPGPGREAIPKALVDSSEFEALALQDNWREYFNAKAMNQDSDRAATGWLQPDVQPNLRTPIADFSGTGHCWAPCTHSTFPPC
jgi:hypothetical protein